MQPKKPKLKRRDFIGNLSKVSILSALSTVPFSGFTKPKQHGEHEDEHAFLCKPYLQTPAPDRMTIMFIMKHPSYSWVEWGEGDNLDKKAHSVTAGLVDANDRINRITLQWLKPNTKYSYRVVSKKIEDFQPYKLTYGPVVESEVYNFSTPAVNKESVNWLVLNDIHDRPESIPHLIGLNGSDPYDFVFFNGDMFDYQTDEQQIIDHMLTPCVESFASRTPFLFVRGNHETRGKFARQLHHYFSNPGNGYYFSYEQGPVYAIVLDTGEDKPDSHEVYAGITDFDAYREEQAIWLKKEIQKPAFQKAKFRVVMMHIPHFHSGDWHGPTHCRKMFAPLFEEGKIDMFIAGHTHRWALHEPMNGLHSYPIIIGGGPTKGKRTLMKVKADGKQLTVQMLDDEGKEVVNHTVQTRV